MKQSQQLLDAEGLLARTKIFIFDCDGVIWLGENLIPGARETLEFLRDQGKIVLFVTNNSTKSRATLARKFQGLGIAAEVGEIYTSSLAAAVYLREKGFHKNGKKVYVVGERGLEEELSLANISVVGGEAFKGLVPDMSKSGRVEVDKSVGAVVVGFDRHINYYKIQYAQVCINQNDDCEFVATNTDANGHLTDAQIWAANGSIVGAIRGCANREPTVVGKPEPLIIDDICERFKVKREEMCMVGDRLDTDILFGRNHGLNTLLVLSGVTSQKDLLAPENSIVPNFYAESIVALSRTTATAKTQ